MFSKIRTWAGFVKLSHTVFALPFALAAMAIAARDNRGWPGWRTFLLVVGAMVSARTCAMAFNRIVDRKFDSENPRTAGRHLPTGQIGLPSAIALCALSGAGLVACAWALNTVCLMLSPLALFFICFYSLTKRFTDYTHVWLGIALALAPLGAWLAVQGGLDFFPERNGELSLRHSAFVVVMMSVAVVFWLIGFDIIYALQDYEFDRRHGLHSLVVAWGPGNALMAAFLAHMIMWGLLALMGLLARFHLPYLAGMLIILGSLLLEHFIARRHNRKPEWVQIAFFRLNGLISVVFLTVTVAEVIFPGFRLSEQLPK